MKTSLRRKALLRAAVTTFIGFGAMNFFQSLLREETTHLRGLYSYWAASIGDALCLPVITAGLFMAKESLEPTNKDQVAGFITGGAAALVSTINQYNWLADPDPDLNWTLVAPHTFNIAGWYHAGFSVVLPTYIGYQLGVTLVRRRSSRSPLPRSFKYGLSGALGASGVFAILLVLDNITSINSNASLSTLISLGITIALLGAASIPLFKGRILK